MVSAIETQVAESGNVLHNSNRNRGDIGDSKICKSQLGSTWNIVRKRGNATPQALCVSSLGSTSSMEALCALVISCVQFRLPEYS